MIKILEEAIAKVLRLPEADQEEAAQILLWALEKHDAPLPLDDETAAAIDEGIAQARRGEFASSEEIAAIWKRDRSLHATGGAESRQDPRHHLK